MRVLPLTVAVEVSGAAVYCEDVPAERIVGLEAVLLSHRLTHQTLVFSLLTVSHTDVHSQLSLAHKTLTTDLTDVRGWSCEREK